MQKDKTLCEQIRQAFMLDDRLSEQPIEVAVLNGTATLTGTVQSHNRKLAAQLIATSIEGCRGVVNELQVEPPGHLLDERIAEYVRAALDAHADITKETVTVSVSNGAVTLNGSVGSHWERTLAEDLALGCKGVCTVKNLLVMNLGGQIEDEALCREIQASLAYTRGLRDTDLRVAVNGDTAVLSGEVPELWQKEAAETVAKRFRVSCVRNEIVVTNE
jgi:osmotically-inducible protein OsmY